MTFVVESMAAANAILRSRRAKEQQLLLNQENEVINATDDMNLISQDDADIEDESCDIQERIEMVKIEIETLYFFFYIISLSIAGSIGWVIF